MEDSTSVSTSDATAEVCESLIKQCLFYMIQITEKRVTKILGASRELSVPVRLVFLHWRAGIIRFFSFFFSLNIFKL